MDISGLLFGLFIVAIFLIIASMRKGSSAVSNKPSKLKSFTVDMNLKQVKKSTLEFSQNNKYDLDEFDESTNRFILSDGATGTSWGFFYPIYLEEKDGSTFIEIGIKSKVFQVGPTVNRSHEKFANAFKAFLAINN